MKPFVRFKLRFDADHISNPYVRDSSYFGRLAPESIIDSASAASAWHGSTQMWNWPICGVYREM